MGTEFQFAAVPSQAAKDETDGIVAALPRRTAKLALIC